MSTDTVDIIHAAEDYAESLRLKARRVIDTLDALRSTQTSDYPDAERRHTHALRQLGLGSTQPFIRPGCYDNGEDEPRTCDEDCGGYHPGDDE